VFDAAFAWFLGAIGALFALIVAYSSWMMWRGLTPAAAEYLDRPMPDSLWASRVVSYGALFAFGYAALVMAGPRNSEGAVGLALVGAFGAWAVAVTHWTLHHVVYSIEGRVFTARCGLMVARAPLDGVQSVTRSKLSPWRRGWRGLERGAFLVNNPTTSCGSACGKPGDLRVAVGRGGADAPATPR
jgi:hypothetical protein